MVSKGTVLSGRYRMEERIAGGGMGDVWRGTDEVLGRTVAIKIMLPALLDEPGFVERFRVEARTMATINHAGVVRIYDFGNDQDVAYLIMEYVEGEALSRTLNKVGRLTPARTMSLIAQAADALHAAHEKGIVHRDVKPGNLLVRPNGTLVLTDFGIARSAAAGQLTATGAVLGTASYLAPEQAAGTVASAASDVYSLGVVAYQCLTGHRPYDGDTPLEIAMKHVNGTPRPMPADIPLIVRQLVMRAMAKEPSARWESSEAMGDAARKAALGLGQPGSATLPVAPVSPSPVSPGPVASPVRQPPQNAQVRGGGQALAAAHQVPFQRGSAAVPARPAPVPQYRPHPAPSAPSGGGRTLVIVGIVVTAILVVACAGYLGYWLKLNEEKPRTAGPSDQVTISAAAEMNGADYEAGNITEGRRSL